MTTEAINALTAAIEGADGLPIPTAREYAERLDKGLAARGYQITRAVTPRGDLAITGYPCTCKDPARRGCLEHPFGPVR